MHALRRETFRILQPARLRGLTLDQLSLTPNLNIRTQSIKFLGQCVSNLITDL
jgi:hypothetical protein